MYRDDDPYLSELREVCLALPESADRQVALVRMLTALDGR
jgi:hypothetical protein